MELGVPSGLFKIARVLDPLGPGSCNRGTMLGKTRLLLQRHGSVQAIEQSSPMRSPRDSRGGGVR